MTGRALPRGLPSVRLEPPTLERQDEFLAAVHRSREHYRQFASPPKTPDGYRRFVEANRSDTRDSHFVVDGATGSLVGFINVENIARGLFKSSTVGYIGLAPHIGHGRMRAGLVLVLDRVFGALGLHRIEANIQPDNERSKRMVQALGFRLEGYSPRFLKICGRWRDHERWAILSEEWPAARRAAGRNG